MITDQSFGVVPVRKKENALEVLVIQRLQGFWEFPKGHKEEGEEPFESACRELKEETAVNVISLVIPDPFTIHYQFSSREKLIDKVVFYFVAWVDGACLPQPNEVKDCRWVPIHQARDQVTFSTSKVLCDQVIESLKLAGLLK